MSALPVLYSFRRCPYAMRARLALAVSGQRCELREVVLKAKPQGLLQASPKGTVPVLVLPSGQVLEQSLDIMLWALGQHDPQSWLHPSQGTQAEMQALIAECDGPFKQALDRTKYPTRYPECNPAYERAQGGNLGFQAEPETSRKKLSDINHLARRRPLLGTLKSSRVRPRSSASFSHVGRRPRPAQVLPLPSW